MFQAFASMKEDIKSALHTGPANVETVATPTQQYRRGNRGKKPEREIFDVEHHDAEDLDLLVRSFLHSLEQY